TKRRYSGSRSMDTLWSPWRFRYVTEAGKTDRCIFCEKAAGVASHDREQLILHRGRTNFVILNLYPYTTGHTMIAPYAHVADLLELEAQTLREMMELAQKVQAALKATYNPEGYNLGMNLGKCAGAGVAGHLHLHFLPRWGGDTNFMTVVSETRVHPEDLLTTYDKLVGFFRP
ncbi:MAG: HIT domain-containing protein, partial [Terriglobia bacterium]